MEGEPWRSNHGGGILEGGAIDETSGRHLSGWETSWRHLGNIWEAFGKHLGSTLGSSIWAAFGRLEAGEAYGRHLEVKSHKPLLPLS